MQLLAVREPEPARTHLELEAPPESVQQKKARTCLARYLRLEPEPGPRRPYIRPKGYRSHLHAPLPRAVNALTDLSLVFSLTEQAKRRFTRAVQEDRCVVPAASARLS